MRAAWVLPALLLASPAWAQSPYAVAPYNTPGISNLPTQSASLTASQAASSVLAAPAGGSGAPSFRLLTPADISGLTASVNTILASPPAIGSTTAAAGAFSSLVAGSIYSGKATRLNDVNVPVQIDSQTVGQAFFGADKNGGYGLLMGYVGNAGQIRQVTTDPLQILVSSTAVAAQFNSNLSTTFYGPVSLAAGAIDTSVAATTTLASGNTVTPATNQGGTILYCSGMLATLTVNLPATPVAGQVFHIASYCTVTALSLGIQAGQYTSGSPGSISPTAPLAFIYDAPHTTWVAWR